jgi:mono/diheme cytochrome c family protein
MKTALVLGIAAIGFGQEGTRVYIAHCQQCHDQNSDAHAPLVEALGTKPWQDILKALGHSRCLR